MALGKEAFADGFFTECNRGFAERPKHSAKSPSAVVIGLVASICLLVDHMFFFSAIVSYIAPI